MKPNHPPQDFGSFTVNLSEIFDKKRVKYAIKTVIYKSLGPPTPPTIPKPFSTPFIEERYQLMNQIFLWRYVTHPSWWISQRYRVTKWWRGKLDDCSCSWWSVTNNSSQPGIGLVPSTYICSSTLTSAYWNVGLVVGVGVCVGVVCRQQKVLLVSDWPLLSLVTPLLSFGNIKVRETEP